MLDKLDIGWLALISIGTSLLACAAVARLIELYVEWREDRATFIRKEKVRW